MRTTEWMGAYRQLIESIIGFANHYASLYNKEFMGETVKYSFAQIQVVECILEKEECNYKMIEIANCLGVTASSFTKLVNKLVNKGLLQKYHIKGNRKDVILQVTDEGKKIYQEYVENVAKNIFKEFMELGKEISDVEMQKLVNMLYSLHKIKIENDEPVVLETY